MSDLTSTILSFRRTAERMAEAMLGASRTIRCIGYRMKGWSDLADVIQHQEGREIVRSGMRENGILAWLGEEPPCGCCAREHQHRHLLGCPLRVFLESKEG